MAQKKYFSPHCVESDAGFYQRDRTNWIPRNFLRGMVGIVAYQPHESFNLWLLYVFDSDVVFAVKRER